MAGCRAIALAAVVAAGLTAPAASPAEPTRAVISIIIDDLGNVRSEGLRALELRGDLTYAFLPHTPFAARLARLASVLGKEVMLHLPMEAADPRRLGPGGLTRTMGRDAVRRALFEGLASVPNARGVNNHMGSALTREPAHMGWLMDALSDRGQLYFVDSRTTSGSVAMRTASMTGVPTTERDVFLDNDREPDAVAAQLRTLYARARARGSALGIAHPYPETLAVLEHELARLSRRGVELVPVSSLIGTRLARARTVASAGVAATR